MIKLSVKDNQRKVNLEVNFIESYLIAKMINVEHKIILDCIDKNKRLLNIVNNNIKIRKIVENNNFKYYLLTQEQTIYLLSLVNNEHSKDISIINFNLVKKMLVDKCDYKSEVSSNYIINRDIKCLLDKNTIKLINKFEKYINNVSIESNVINNIVKLLNILLFISKSELPLLENIILDRHFLILTNIEEILYKYIIPGMNNKEYYKDIYKKMVKDFLQFEEASTSTNGYIHKQMLKIIDTENEYE